MTATTILYILTSWLVISTAFALLVSFGLGELAKTDATALKAIVRPSNIIDFPIAQARAEKSV